MFIGKGGFSNSGLLASASTLSLLFALPAHSLPQGGQVSAGDATIANTTNLTTVTQGSDRAVIDWQKFDVSKGEVVDFKQPSNTSITLNRIHDQQPSSIYGQVKANGTIALINPNGIMFGKDSRVDVSGLVASTADISNDAFMDGGPLKFNKAGNSNARIVNSGTVTVRDKGLAAFVAPNVQNNGVIAAQMGKVHLAGAETATIDLYGDGLVSIAVEQTQATSVTNGGRIEAGNVVLTAADADRLVSSTVSMNGVIEASHMNVAADGSYVLGGDVKIAAREINLAAGANIRADGFNGGGTVKIGGGWQGEKIALTANPHAAGTLEHQQWELNNAQNVTIAKDTLITANATQKGDGGTVVAWSDDATRFAGKIQAKGGAQWGHGGKVETSGKNALGVTGTVDASAKKGNAGQWLLDPRNVTISGGGAYSVNSGGETVDPGTDNFTILASSISTALTNGNNVTITTGTTGTQTGNITLDNATISKTGGVDATLTLKAEGSILTSGTNSISSNTGKLHTTFWADAEAVPNSNGYISLANTTITTNGGNIVMGGGTDPLLNAAVTPLDFLNGVYLSSTALSAGGGNITLRGQSTGTNQYQHGVNIISSTVSTTGNGNITIYGYGGPGAAGVNYGTRIDNSTLSLQNGAAYIFGQGGAASNGNHGVAFESNGSLTSNGSATITIEGIGGAGTGTGFRTNNVGSNVIGGALATGDINILTNNISVTNLDMRTDGSITIRPRTEPTSIGISGGTCGGSCTLNLTDAILANLNPDDDGNGIGSLIIGNSAAATGTVDINGWDLSGKTYDVEVYGGLVDFTGATIWNGDNNLLFYSRNNDLMLDQDFTRNAGTAGNGTLTLKTSNYITSSGTRTITAATGATSGKLHTILWSDADNSGVGAVSVSDATITTNGGNFVAAGGLDDGADILNVSGNVIVDGTANDGIPDNYTRGGVSSTNGIRFDNVDIATGAGNIQLLGQGRNAAAGSSLRGISILNGSNIQTSTGTIIASGVGGAGTNQNYGITMQDTGTTFTSTGGAITINGQGSGTGNFGYGIDIRNGATVVTSGNNDITITGRGANGGSESRGFHLSAGGSKVESVDGDIRITGIGGNGTSTGSKGIVIGSASVVSLGTGAGAGTITLTGTGGAGTGNSYGVDFSGGTNSVLSTLGAISITGTGGTGGSANHGINSDVATTIGGTGNAPVTLTGSRGDTNAGTYDINFITGPSVIGDSNSAGDITFISDTLSMSNTTVYSKNNILIKPLTEPTSVGISGGTCGSTCTLNITDTILSALNADSDANGTGSLIIGDSTDAAGTVDINGWDISGKTYDVEVYGGTVDFTGDITWSRDNNFQFFSRTGDLAIDYNFARNAGTAGDGTLTFKASGNITSSGSRSITAASGVTSGKLHTILWSDAEAVPNSNGMISLTDLNISTNGGDVIMGGGLDDGTDIFASTDGTTLLHNGIAGDGRPDGLAWGNATTDDGITLNNTDVLTGAGNIIVRGRGRNAATGNQIGVLINNTSLIETTSGTILIDGKGGNAGADNSGVLVADVSTIVRSDTGSITLSGTGGDSAGSDQHGVRLQSSATVSSLSTAPINLYGKGGSAGVFSYGSFVGDSTISSPDGDISIIGVGAGSNNAHGIRISNSNITSNGSADITLDATKGNGAASNDFRVQGATSLVGGPNATGQITIITDQIGVFQDVSIQTQNNVRILPRTAGSTIGISGGTCGSTCNIALTDAILSTLNPDIDANGTGTLIIGNSATGTGNVDIDDWNLSGKTYDVEVYGGTVDFSTNGTTWNRDNSLLFYSRTGDLLVDQGFVRNAGGTGTGTLTLKAAGNVNISRNIDISSASGAQNIVIWSDAETVPNSDGYILLNNMSINSNGGDVILGGGLDDGANGGTAADGRPDNFARGNGTSNHGVFLNIADITAGNGSILAYGKGVNGTASAAAYGVYLNGDSDLSTTNGAITLRGEGGAGTTINSGIGLIINGGGSSIASQSGAINLHGVGKGSGGFNHGTRIRQGSTVSSTDGNITITGTSGDTGASNYGVFLSDAGTAVTSTDGDIQITGTGIGTTASNYGVNLSTDVDITSNGTGASAGNITINGTGGNGTDNNFGVFIGGAGTTLSTIDGDIAVIGQGGNGAGAQNTGIWMSTGADIISDGTGASAGKITLQGTAGTGNGSLMGTYILDAGTTITSKVGKITIEGTGGNGAAVGNNYGTRISNATITSVTSADIEINGTAGNAGSANRGVYIFNTDTLVTTQGTGNITITGYGGDAAGTSSNHGVYVRDGAEITSTATGATAGRITINGFSGDSDNNNYGVYITENTTKVTTVDGAIEINGTGGTGTGTWNEGIYFNSQAEISSFGVGANAGSITLRGTAGSGTNNQFGLDMENGAFISSRDGDIALFGTGGSIGGGANNQGIHLNGVSITTNGDANISLTGTSTTAGSIDILQNGTASTIGTAGTTTGNVTYNANTISVSDLTTRTNNDIIFKPRTAGTSIGISGGTCGATCTLDINDALLAKTFADNDANGTGTLIIGDAAAGTGLVEIAGWDISGRRHDVEVYGGTVNFDTGAIRWNQDNNLLFYSRTGNINIDTGFSRDAGVAGDGTLTLKAAGSITTSGTRSITAATAGATGKLHTILWSDSDNSGSGLISLSDLTVTTNGGDFVAAGGLDDGADIIGSDGATVLYNGTAADGRPDNYAIGTSGANNDGILFDTVDVTTGTGNIILRGHGFDEAVGANDYKIGLAVFDDSDLLTTTGNVILNGVGGNGNSYGRGVGIYDATTSVSTTSGAISVMGRGATTGGQGLQGILFFDGALIRSTGTGAGVGAITLDGVGGSGTGFDHGIFMDTAANLQSADANVTITGVGGDGGGDNHGALIQASNISVAKGNLSITGVGGDSVGAGGNRGVFLNNATTISSTGAAGAAGTITIHGTGGAGTSNNAGIFINATGTTISSGYGNIQITGIGGTGTGTDNQGIRLETNAVVSSTGTGAQAASITLNGTATAGTDRNSGIHIIDSDITTVDGAVSLTGVGKGTGVNNHGVIMNTNATVVSTSTTAGRGNITIDATGGDGVNANYGFHNTTGATLTAATGNIQITGRGGVLATGNDNFGVWTNANLATTLGNITLLGTGGGGGGAGNFNDGVYMNADLSTTDGNIVITGNAGNAATGRGQIGSYIEGNLTSTGTGNITINGNGGNAGTDINYGVYVTGGSTRVEVNNGNLQVTGTGGNGSADKNYGVYMLNSSTLASVGTGATAGNITISGTGGNGTRDNYGVWMQSSGTLVTAVDGDISITGIGGNGSNRYNAGIIVSEGADVTSTGTGASAGNITLHGTSGNGTQDLVGVYIGVNNSTIVTKDGDIQITGIGKNGSVANHNYGIEINNSGKIISQGDGHIALAGTAGTGTGGDNSGIYIHLSSEIDSQDRGNITITGNGGGTGSGNHGVAMETDSMIRSKDGTISLTGTRGDTNAATHDIYLTGGTQTIGGATATGAITFNANTVSIANTTTQTSGSIYLKPRTTTGSIGVGGGAGGLQLTDALLDQMHAGTSLIIGRSDLDADITLDTYAWEDPVQFLTAVTGDIIVNGNQTSDAASDASFTFSGPTILGGTVNIANATSGTRGVTFGGTTTLSANSTINTGAGNVDFVGATNGGYNLNITTTGDLTFTGNVGTVTPLANVTITSVNDFTADSFYSSNFTLTGGTGNVAFSNTSLHATGTVDIATNGNITGNYYGATGKLYAGAGQVNAKVNFGTLDINGAGATLTGGFVGATGPADQTMANLISIGGVTYPALIPNAAYTYEGFIIGGAVLGGGGGGGGGGAGGGSSSSSGGSSSGGLSGSSGGGIGGSSSGGIGSSGGGSPNPGGLPNFETEISLPWFLEKAKQQAMEAFISGDSKPATKKADKKSKNKVVYDCDGNNEKDCKELSYNQPTIK